MMSFRLGMPLVFLSLFFVVALTLGATAAIAQQAAVQANQLTDVFRGVLLSQAQPGTPAAQSDDPWRLTFTPQFWFSYIPPLVTTATLGPSTTIDKTLQADRTPPIFTQSGGNIALGKGPWTFAVGVLFVEYAMLETDTLRGGAFFVDPVGRNLGPVATIRWDVLRTDTDVALTYAFLDVIPDFLDLSVGGGLKHIHISTERIITFPSGATFGGSRNALVFNEDILAGTIPIGLNMHLGEHWFFPMTVTPIYGTSTNRTEAVYGVTGDVGLRYRFSNGVSFFAGVRGQYIHGGPTGDYAAAGPIISLSVPVTF